MVLALSLDEAKQKGLVGENDNGYLGLVVNDTDAKILVADINTKRKSVYIKLAAENGITLQQVEKLAAKKGYDKTLSGHYLLVEGQWVKK